jgi:Ser/Thr protein kinase RdoA (MazF antagonist)
VVQCADYILKKLPDRFLAQKLDWGRQPWQLLHRDVQLDNVLFDESGNVQAIFDYDNAGLGFRGIELMSVWDLCVCSDPGEPQVDEGSLGFFRAYQAAYPLPEPLWPDLVRAYWLWLAADPWPVQARFAKADGAVEVRWMELLALRLRALRWLGRFEEKLNVQLRRVFAS